MKALTVRQKLVFEFIRNYIEEKEYAPSFREIQQHFGFASLASVHKYIKALETKGMLISSKGCSRSLELREEAITGVRKAVVTVPFMGYLSQHGIESLSQVKTMDLPPTMVASPQNSYLLRVKGNFLKEVSIEAGDLLVIESQQDLESGRLSLLQKIGSQFLVKRYFTESGGVRLRVDEEDEGEFFSEEQLTVYGAVVAILRTF